VGFAQDFVNQPLGTRVSEDELITHLIVPFFRALGWRQEQIAVKWGNVDVALFGQLPRTPENCRLVIEAKRHRRGGEAALEQGIRYVRELGLSCDVMVADGYTCRLFGAGTDYEPVAYANLLRLKRSALDLFGRLRPR
jgi:hypothetical protein